MLPNFDLPFRIEADSSALGVGGVLSQRYENHWRPVAYYSKHLFLLTADSPASRLARLQNRFKLYSYTIEYRAGNCNGNADALSRLVDDDDIDENGEVEDDDVVINFINLRTNELSDTELNDQDIQNMLNYKNIEKEFKKKPKLIDDESVTDELRYM